VRHVGAHSAYIISLWHGAHGLALLTLSAYDRDLDVNKPNFSRIFPKIWRVACGELQSLSFLKV
jgi:hypothetical protein